MNLIICCTPLQVLIAEKIIEMHPNEQFLGAMLHTVENPKFSYYKQRLKEKTDAFFSMQQHTDRISLLKEIIYLKQYFKGKKFKRVFVANFTELHIQFLLSAITFEQFNTFDDGTVNIVKNSPFLKDDQKTFIRQVINLLLGNKYHSQKLRRLSHMHYTIYPNFPNIIQNTINIPLMEDNQTEINEQIPINILLGQPVYQDNHLNITLAQRVIKQFNIDYYLPHPREKYHLENVEYIDTPLIFEDYMLQYFSNRKCRVYTYFSSAILNILNKNPNIEVIALRVETDDLGFIDCYKLFEKVGVQIIDIRE